jgi:putative ABC transport system substrate-binding protein
VQGRQSRRRFLRGAGLTGLGLLAGCGLPVAAPPPAARVHRIAYLLGGQTSGENEAAFRQSLRDLGYVEGQNLVIDQRIAASREHVAETAAEVVRLQPEVIVVASVQIARAAQAATSAIPIVSAGAGDLVFFGVVASLGQPGANVTGLSTPSLAGKQLQLLQQAVPMLSRVAVFLDVAPNFEGLSPFYQQELYEAAAFALGLQLQLVGLRGPESLEPGIEAALREHADGLFFPAGPVISGNHTRLAELAIQSRLPSMWGQPEAVARGGLLGYGFNRPDLHRRVATYVDKILKGAKPADLPVEQPTKFDFILNLQTARALGLTIAPSLLAQATEVIA